MIKSELQKFGFKFVANNVIPPQYRLEIHNNNDLAEEFLKSLRINDIKERPIDLSNLAQNKYTEYYFNSNIRKMLSNNYFYECKCYNMSPAKDLETFNIFNYTNNIHITSANNINREYLRTNLIHNLLNVYKYNLFHKNALVPIYEMQKIYQTNKPGELNLTCLTPLKFTMDHVNGSQIIYNINGLRGVLDKIADIFNTTEISAQPINNVKIFYANETLAVYYKKVLIGYIGALKESYAKNFDITEPIYILSINLNALISNFTPPKFNLNAISTTQVITKDITFIFNVDKPLQPLLDQIKALPYVKDFSFIDKYQDEKKITYTIRVEFKQEKNITKDEINKYILEIMKLSKN
jgi:phenylalanyl-tRNA synthetase beta chain